LQQQFFSRDGKIEVKWLSKTEQSDKIDSGMRFSVFVLSKTVGTNTVGSPLGELPPLFAQDIH